METGESRSRAVIEDFKRRKLAASALRRIHELLRGFERERAADRRLAAVGMTLLVLVLLLVAWGFFDRVSIVIP